MPTNSLARLIEDIPGGVALFDRELRYVAANSSWAGGLGLSTSALSGSRHDEIDPVGGRAFVELQRRALHGETATISGEVHAAADDSLHRRSISVKPWRGQDGSLLGVAAALHDIVVASASGGAVGERLPMCDRLRRALDDGEFVLHYQPIFSLASDRIVGAEALLRWNRPRDGLLAPKAFLPLLEESGLIVPVGCWVIRQAARQAQIWRTLYGRDLVEWISINVSALQFDEPAVLLDAFRESGRGGFPLDRLRLEITESTAMRNPAAARAVIAQLRELGIRVALDDFGTGYSALGALRRYAIDTVKIDREFTRGLDTPDGRDLLTALVKIARIYDAAVVAEGIETVGQCEILREAGCDFGQGLLFAQPMEGSRFGTYALTHFDAGEQAR